jgi:hypothetical protein
MPPTQGVNHFAIAGSAGEVLLTVGQTRVMMVASGASPVPTPGVEWLMTLSMSPTSAVSLLNILKSVVDALEATFGKIAVDPAAKPIIKVPGPASG